MTLVKVLYIYKNILLYYWIIIIDALTCSSLDVAAVEGGAHLSTSTSKSQISPESVDRSKQAAAGMSGSETFDSNILKYKTGTSEVFNSACNKPTAAGSESPAEATRSPAGPELCPPCWFMSSLQDADVTRDDLGAMMMMMKPVVVVTLPEDTSILESVDAQRGCYMWDTEGFLLGV